MSPNLDSPCEYWEGFVTEDGYGRTGNQRRAHRVAYETAFGAIPDGLEIDHLCHTYAVNCSKGSACLHRRCVNPDHLEPVTHAENMRRSAPAQAVVCINGHPYDETNTYIRTNGRRDCRICIRVRLRSSALRRKAA